MSYARGLGQNGGRLYSNITMPAEIFCNFIVDSTNGNGLGIRSLKSNGYLESVFMHTSASPGRAPNGFLNPNPPVGYAVVQMKNNFNYYLGGRNGVIPPLASSNLTSVTTSSVYVITSVGSTTLAQWQAAGLIPGLTPAVGQAFVAIKTGALGGSGTVGAPGVPTTLSFSVVGDPNTSIANSAIAPNAGAYMVVQMLAATSAGSTVLVPAAPADGTVISLSFVYDRSSVTIDGL